MGRERKSALEATALQSVVVVRAHANKSPLHLATVYTTRESVVGRSKSGSLLLRRPFSFLAHTHTTLPPCLSPHCPTFLPLHPSLRKLLSLVAASSSGKVVGWLAEGDGEEESSLRSICSPTHTHTDGGIQVQELPLLISTKLVLNTALRLGN